MIKITKSKHDKSNKYIKYKSLIFINIINPSIFILLFWGLAKKFHNDFPSMLVLIFDSLINLFIFQHVKYDKENESNSVRNNYILLIILNSFLLLDLCCSDFWSNFFSVNKNVWQDLFNILIFTLILVYFCTFVISIYRPKRIYPFIILFFLITIFGFLILYHSRNFFLVISLFVIVTNIMFDKKNYRFLGIEKILRVEQIPDINWNFYRFILNICNSSFIIIKLLQKPIEKKLLSSLKLFFNFNKVPYPATYSAISVIDNLTAGIAFISLSGIFTILIYFGLLLIGHLIIDKDIFKIFK